MNDVSVAEIRSASRWGTALGILTIVMGVIAITAPLYAGLAVATVVGVLLLLGGASQLAFAFKAPSLGRGVLVFLFGVFTLLAGIVVLGRPLFGLASITLVLAFYFFADGIGDVVTAFRIRPNAGWSWLLLEGIVSVLLGFMIWQRWPMSGAWALGVLVGVRLLFAGWTMIALGGLGRAVAHQAENTPAPAD